MANELGALSPTDGRIVGSALAIGGAAKLTGRGRSSTSGTALAALLPGDYGAMPDLTRAWNGLGALEVGAGWA